MHNSIMGSLPLYKETRFRSPNPTERDIGLWVDRIGAGRRGVTPNRLRILGQYGMVCIDAGKGTAQTDRSGPVEIEDGDIILITPGLPLNYFPAPQWQTRWIVWNGPEADTLYTHGMMPRNTLVLKEGGAIFDTTFSQLRNCIDAETRAAAVERKALILDLFVKLHRFQRSRETQSTGESVAEEAVDYINANLDAELRIPDVAEQFNLSPTHFRRIFKRHTGQSPTRYRNTKRINKAKELLLQGRPIKEAAAQTGFSDVYYFMRMFKNITGMTAGEFAETQTSAHQAENTTMT